MKILFIILISLCLLDSCKTIVAPDIKESEAIIEYNKPLIQFNEALIDSRLRNKPVKTDWSIRVKLSALNNILRYLAEKSIKDILIQFLYSEKILSEKYSLLGINVENYVNLDTGNINIDIKQLELSGRKDTLNLKVVAAGSGSVSLSARYMGIPASASPDMEILLDELISFRVVTGNEMEIVLEAIPKKLKLKTKFYVGFLAWQIPWSKDMELEASEIIKPLKLPLSGLANISLPVPSKPGANERQKLDYKLKLKDFFVDFENGVMELRSDIELEKILQK